MLITLIGKAVLQILLAKPIDCVMNSGALVLLMIFLIMIDIITSHLIGIIS